MQAQAADVDMSLMSTPVVPLTLSALVPTYLIARCYRPDAAKVVRYTLTRFARSTDDCTPTALTVDHVLAWWATLAHLAPSTRRHHHSVVGCYLGHLRTLGLLAGDPLAAIRRPVEPRRSPVTFSPADLTAIERACVDERERAMVALMLRLGLRCCEVARLQVADVDTRSALVEIHGKGGHRDVLPLTPAVASAVDDYLTAHPAVAGPLVRDARWHRHPITAQRVSEVMAQLTTRAGVRRGRYDGRGAHALRRTCATDLLDRGAHIRQVQAVLRHASLTSTQLYLRRGDAEGLRSVMA